MWNELRNSQQDAKKSRGNMSNSFNQTSFSGIIHSYNIIYILNIYYYLNVLFCNLFLC